jgi:hypothetical protein
VLTVLFFLAVISVMAILLAQQAAISVLTITYAISTLLILKFITSSTLACVFLGAIGLIFLVRTY